MRTVLAWVRGHRRLLMQAVGVLLVAICVAGIWWAFVFVVPGQLVQPNDVPDITERSKQRQDERRILLQTLTGVLVLGGAFVAWRQLLVTREGQITERFTRAIDQLGDDKVEVRLGGIYALERLARDSRVDERTITEVLCAYVRHRSPRRENRERAHSRSSWLSWIGSFPRLPANRREAEGAQMPPLQARAGDVQAAMTVLGGC
jgi:hypothetical protein